MASQTFTELLDVGRRGNQAALNVAYEMVFRQLRRTAALLLDREARCRTLQPTALVADFYLRINRMQGKIMNREHFLSLAARSMKRQLIDHGRGKAVRKRLDPILFGDWSATSHPDSANHMAVRQVWEGLRKVDPRTAEIVWLLKAEGMTLKEVSRKMQRPVWRLVEDCEFALGWMAKRLN
jgi:RNA polymerase sigma factor (TIGR02999 family)